MSGITCVLCCIWLLVTPWTIALQAPLSMEFSRQEYWSGWPFPPPKDLPDPELEPEFPASLALGGVFFTTEPSGKPRTYAKILLIKLFFHHLKETCENFTEVEIRFRA